jgi:hypothetical protein
VDVKRTRASEVRGMPCPKCGGSSEVIKVRKISSALRRRRRCLSCEHRWATTETISEGSTGDLSAPPA